MDEQKNIQDILQHVSQPGFCVRDGSIVSINHSAQALLLAEGDAVQPLLHTGAEEYASFKDGQLYLTLTICGQPHNATVTRIRDLDLFLLDPVKEAEEFRAMALVSMELRGSLMRLMSSAEQLLEDQDLTDPEKSSHAAQMNRSLHQMMRLACNLSDVSRYAAASRKETRDVDSFLEALFEKAGAFTEDKGISLTYEGLRQPLFSQIDPEQLERAVWNILSNSIKFMPQGGSIHARLTRHGSKLQLCIQDTGSGIAQSVKASLFHRYLRQPGIEDSRFGLGLGMVIIRTAAANHGGTVLIDRCGETGTRLTMTLTISQDPGNQLRSPILRPDYTGGWDHGLLELSDSLSESKYREI